MDEPPLPYPYPVMNYPTHTPENPSDTPCESPVKHRAIDPWREAKTQPARELVNRVFTSLLDHESKSVTRRRARKKQDELILYRQVNVTISNLATQCLSGDKLPLRVSRSNRVLGTTDQYSRGQCFTTAYPKVLDALSAPEIGLLSLTVGESYHRSQRPLNQSCIAPTERFISLLDAHGIGLDDFTRNFQGEPIVLKSEKHRDPFTGEASSAKLLYKDTAETRRLRREMNEINSWLYHADLNFDEALSDSFVDISMVQLHRVFNNGSFKDGGRLYGGFWQRLSKEQRAKGLSINGSDTVSLDYGQIAPRILYSMVGMVPDFDDAYAIPGLDPDMWRPIIKKVCSSMLFKARDPKKIPDDIRKKWPNPLVRIESLVDMIKEYHRPVAHLFCTEMGFKVFRKESDIMVDVLLTLKSLGIVGLPVHDCVIVAKEHEAYARGAMQVAFRKHLGFDPVIERE